MKELKTLKEIHFIECFFDQTSKEMDIESTEYFIKKELKAEAVKDYKRLLEVYQKGDTLFKEHGKIAEGFEVNVFDYEQDDVAGILKYIKWKFNLSEEDLK